ncbi:probable inactive dual specificity protein phosphatase-like At4g18593 [Selaginella moellendorffii]|uniref:probable inactive dual specificity protein phosphatase-like At4g18593 n=1 Tax=Selaginella moellendorffii TaxID=88036 RepID=UPI000D1C7DBD|nr:probable inactive dual specificity protein phosphatase-like At4g18593 [Selaginella moellendorffii]|eukprot:XP_024525963.1 probable inactive dual specificity protein phosphatase-like At4g18593 [Selaginella moellendorffii]
MEEASIVYRCRKCRQIVATDSSVQRHDPGSGEQAFSWKKRSNNDEAKPRECSSIFVEPMQWMNGVQDGSVEGKLLCNVCQARLGSFNWSGLQCSCGAWVNPAFQLHKNRLDATTLVVSDREK